MMCNCCAMGSIMIQKPPNTSQIHLFVCLLQGLTKVCSTQCQLKDLSLGTLAVAIARIISNSYSQSVARSFAGAIAAIAYSCFGSIQGIITASHHQEPLHSPTSKLFSGILSYAILHAIWRSFHRSHCNAYF